MRGRIAVVGLLVAGSLGACGSDRAKEKPADPSVKIADDAGAVAPIVADAAEAIVLPPAPPLPDVPRGLPKLPDTLAKITPDQVALGELLFWDPRLSSTGKISCATCHEPSRNYSGDARLPTADGAPNLRRAQSLVNLAWTKELGWDGRYASFAEHLAAHVHGQYRNDLNAAVGKIAGIPTYRAHFTRVGGGDPSADIATTALHAFVMTRYNGDSRWDQEERASGPRGNPGPLRRGYALFTGKAQCSVCHTPPLYTDQRYHRLGLITVKDEGRGKIDPAKRGAFKTPGLRGATDRPSLFHDGSAADLEAAIDHHLAGAKSQGADPSIVDVKPVALTAEERADLVAFVKSLSNQVPAVQAPVMP